MKNQYAKRKDANHNLIADAFTKLGYKVVDTSRLGDDFPDIAISKAYITALIEIKAEKGKMSEGQWDFYKDWLGHIFLCKTLDDVTKIHGIMAQEAAFRSAGFRATREPIRDDTGGYPTDKYMRGHAT